ncbi:MAG: tRNA (adenosine(37)-N6)-dimethylallyltransferase MiaA [Candidatus Wallbacteria bacterium]|nr:tRNA (adenosine(37)-N6)-dimethylallyltransferase MiaA [Candidatus Wallbacteria bacterium]
MPDGVRLLVLTGPTASGKTAVAVQLAEQLGGEVVSADSMQVYRGLAIVSAAPSEADRGRVPHHLLGIIEPRERFDAARFRSKALELAVEIAGRGRVPIVAGGSGLYLSALVDGLSELPRADAALRQELTERSNREGPGWLHAELERLDPEGAARLHPNDSHRLVRALEICRLTGRPYSVQVGARRPLVAEAFAAFALDVPREELCRRIDLRARRMLEDGALGEVARILGVEGSPASAGPAGLAALPTARQMLGVPQLAPCLAGEEPVAAGLERLARDTRRFARKQLAWCRRLRGVRWIAAPDGRAASEIADEISTRWKAGM